MKILIVDDDEDMRIVIRVTLEPLTHNIYEAGNAIEALKTALADAYLVKPFDSEALLAAIEKLN